LNGWRPSKWFPSENIIIIIIFSHVLTVRHFCNCIACMAFIIGTAWDGYFLAIGVGPFLGWLHLLSGLVFSFSFLQLDR